MFKEGEDVRVMAQTGIERKHVVTPGMCMADLAKGAFDGIMAELGWEKNSIDALVLVSSAADYITAGKVPQAGLRKRKNFTSRSPHR